VVPSQLGNICAIQVHDVVVIDDDDDYDYDEKIRRTRLHFNEKR